MHDAASLLTFLNLQEKGADTLILHLGSHSIKFGFASQQQPFIAPNVIAHPRKDGKKLCEINQKARELEITRQEMFDTEIEKALPDIEYQLRKKRFLLIDAKSAKNIRNRQVSFKIFDETNCLQQEYTEQGEDSFSIPEQYLMSPDLNSHIDKFAFVNLIDTQLPNTAQRPHFIGKEALALHKSEEYSLRYPIKFGDLNINAKYNVQECIQDLQTIIESSIYKYMRLPRRHFENFNCILVIPDIFVKHHLRYIVTMVLQKMRFKSLFMHTESIMATFAMAMSTACVVDVGGSKISVCCIDEGLMIPKSIQRKHYGGDELNEVLLRLMGRSKGLHYFPRSILYHQYPYHRQILEYLKETYTLTEMDVGETVKTCTVKIKDKANDRQRKVRQLTFNCSDSLLLAPQSLFYSQIISIIQKINEETTDPREIPRGDPLQVAESFQDPEDLMHDIIQGMTQQANNPSGNLKTAQSFQAKADETPGNTPSVSMAQDAQSEMGDDNTDLGGAGGDKYMTQYRRMQEPMDLDEMICKSICTVENPDIRKRLANSIVLIGGVCKTKKFIDSLEEAVMDRFTSSGDVSIERVNVELYNVQQHQQFLQHQAIMQSAGQVPADSVPDHLKIDPRFTSWLGATVIPKLDSAKDMFILRDKFVVDFKPYKDQFIEQRGQQVSLAVDQIRQDQEEKKEEILNLDSLEQIGNGLKRDQLLCAQPNPEEAMTSAQIEQIEKDIAKKLKKERVFEAGVKQIREKAPFHL